MKLDSYPIPYTKINSKETKDQKLKLLEENKGEKHLDTGLDYDFWASQKKLRLQKQ
jgi:hypothetical protein